MHHSSRPRPAGLTVTTTVSMERLHFLEGLCASWKGPLIAAAYLPLIGGQKLTDDNATDVIQETFNMCDYSPYARWQPSAALHMVSLRSCFYELKVVHASFPDASACIRVSMCYGISCGLLKGW